MKYTNFKVTRTLIKTKKNVCTQEILAENKDAALAIVNEQLKDERKSNRNCQVFCYDGGNDQILSIDEDIVVEEVK